MTTLLKPRGYLGGIDAVNIFSSLPKKTEPPFLLTWESGGPTSCIAVNFYNTGKAGLFLALTPGEKLFSTSGWESELWEYYWQVWTTNRGYFGISLKKETYQKNLSILEWEDLTLPTGFGQPVISSFFANAGGTWVVNELPLTASFTITISEFSAKERISNRPGFFIPLTETKGYNVTYLISTWCDTDDYFGDTEVSLPGISFDGIFII